MMMIKFYFTNEHKIVFFSINKKIRLFAQLNLLLTKTVKIYNVRRYLIKN